MNAPHRCPNPRCRHHAEPEGARRFYSSKGSYLRTDGARIRRFRCKGCRLCFSETTASASYRLRRRDLEIPVARLLAQGHGIRATARLLGVNRKTVQRRLRASGWSLLAGLALRDERRGDSAPGTNGAA